MTTTHKFSLQEDEDEEGERDTGQGEERNAAEEVEVEGTSFMAAESLAALDLLGLRHFLFI